MPITCKSQFLKKSLYLRLLKIIDRLQLQNSKLKKKLAEYKTKDFNVDVLLKETDFETLLVSVEGSNHEIAEENGNGVMDNNEHEIVEEHINIEDSKDLQDILAEHYEENLVTEHENTSIEEEHLQDKT